jgi:hypothetical protein
MASASDTRQHELLSAAEGGRKNEARTTREKGGASTGNCKKRTRAEHGEQRRENDEN